MKHTTIDKHSSHFEISEWSGNGGTQNITNHNFQQLNFIKSKGNR